MTLDPTLRPRRETTVMEHMTAENASEATGEVFDGHDGVHQDRDLATVLRQPGAAG